MPGKLSTHVLDLTAGRPAAGMTIVLSGVNPARGVLKTVTTNADGRTDQPLMGPEAMATGSYEIAFHVGAYFAGKAGATSGAPFLDVVPVRFTISDAGASYHVPLLVTPWAYSTYRGS
jgi:hydroxyisourate hydrolase